MIDIEVALQKMDDVKQTTKKWNHQLDQIIKQPIYANPCIVMVIWNQTQQVGTDGQNFF